MTSCMSCIYMLNKNINIFTQKKKNKYVQGGDMIYL